MFIYMLALFVVGLEMLLLLLALLGPLSPAQASRKS